MTNQTKHSNQLSSDDDLPDVAKKQETRKVGIFICLALMAIAGVVVYVGHSVKPKVETTADETYSVSEGEQSTPAAAIVDKQVETTQSTPVVTAEQMALLQEKARALQERLSSPLMVMNSNGGGQTATTSSQPTVNSDPNMQFMAQASSRTTDVNNASLIGSLNTIVAEGTLIHASLESAINSDLPGFIRASVSEPVYAEDGSTVLVPRGSRLIGEYKSSLIQGQSRIFVVWTRLMTPLGVTVNLGSAGTDSLGMAGIGADQIDRHFWGQFGKASLLSLIGAGASNSGGGKDDPASAYREAVASSFSQSANQSLQMDSAIAPTITVNQGKPIIVFVAKDLNFSAVMPSTQSYNKVF